MKRLFILLFFILALYTVKPYWEKPVSQYIDLSFLDPVDEKVDTFIHSDPFEKTVRFVSDKIDQAMSFLLNDNKSSQPKESNQDHEVEKPNLRTSDEYTITIHNISLGLEKSEVTSILGEAKSVSPNEYGTNWYTYHQDYHNFVMISFDEDNLVNAMYTNDDLITSHTGLKLRSDQKEIRTIFGEPLTEINRGLMTYVLQETDEFDVFLQDQYYLYVFYDIHQQHQVTAVQMIEKSLEENKKEVYATQNDALRSGFEAQLFDLTNASRVRQRLRPLIWDDRAQQSSRGHSEDMAKHRYFNHENLQGLSPFDRMKAVHITFKAAGENLAYGQASSIFAHEGLMNSKGHRENILQEIYSHLGVGVAFNEQDQPYYTENFFTP